jgi:hypothetical protein
VCHPAHILSRARALMGVGAGLRKSDTVSWPPYGIVLASMIRRMHLRCILLREVLSQISIFGVKSENWVSEIPAYLLFSGRSNMPRAIADRIAIFGNTPAGGDPAVIDYNVPLPGAIKGRRLVLVNIPPVAANPWQLAALGGGLDLAAMIPLTQAGPGNYTADLSSAIGFFKDALAREGVPASHLRVVDEADTLLSRPSMSGRTLRSGGEMGEVFRSLMTRSPINYSSSVRFPTALPTRIGPRVTVEGRPEPSAVRPYPDGPLGGTILPQLEEFLDRLGRGIYVVPKLKWSGQVQLLPFPIPFPASNPRLFLIEEYQISSRLGNYGLGKTVKTTSLLPGQSEEVSIETWRTETSKSTYATSVFDSFSSEAANRFESELAMENSTRTTDAVAISFGADFNTKGGLDLGIVSGEASLGLSFDYETRSSREDFSAAASRAVQSHAVTTNSSRESSVTSTAEQTVEQGERNRTVRTFRNVNLRRTLNFVFKEANQEFETKTILTGTRVAFSNGRVGSWREAPLSALRPFLESLLQPGEVDAACQKLLQLAAVAYDASDTPITVLQTLQRQPDRVTWQPADAQPDAAGNYPLPTANLMYRFKPGPLGQGGDAWPVDGLLLRRDKVVLRTDTIIVEALIGQADALDDYALEAQQADAGAKTLANEQQQLVNEALKQLGPDERVAGYTEMFRPDGRLNVALKNLP